MNKILNVGNLPKHLQIFLKEIGGQLSEITTTEIFEMSSIDEFEKGAAGLLDKDISYEIVPPMVDTSTDRGFLVGFEISEPKCIVTLQSYSKLSIYFIECTSEQVKSWTKKIIQHRKQQEEEMRTRKKPTTIDTKLVHISERESND